MPITPEILDEILKDYEKPEDLLSQDGLLQQLTKGLLERALNGELTHHLGYEKHDPAGNNSGNSRNGSTPKVIKGKRGQVEIEVPRDRNGEFEPQLVKKNQKRFDGLDEKIISLYARGMTQSEIKGHLEEIYDCPAPVRYPITMASFLLLSIFDLNSLGVKYSKLECGLSVL